MTIRPVSSGSRSASSAARGNSGIRSTTLYVWLSERRIGASVPFSNRWRRRLSRSATISEYTAYIDACIAPVALLCSVLELTTAEVGVPSEAMRRRKDLTRTR